MSLFALYLQPQRAAARRGPRGAVRQSVPLHRLPADHRGGLHDGRVSGAGALDRTGRAVARRAARRCAAIRRDAGPARCRASRRRAALDELAAALEAEPRALVLAGGTDIGLWVTKQLRELPPIVYVGEVAELRQHARRARRPRDRRRGVADGCLGARSSRLSDARRGGAALRLAAGAQFRHAVRQPRQRLADRRFHAGADRARGANSSCAARTARGASRSRTSTSATSARTSRPGEFIVSVSVPAPPARRRGSPATRCPSASTRTSPRSAPRSPCDVRDGRVEAARIAFGGMAAVSARAPATEAALVGAAWSAAASMRRRRALAADFQPLTRSAREQRLSPAGGRATCCAASSSNTATPRRRGAHAPLPRRHRVERERAPASSAAPRERAPARQRPRAVRRRHRAAGRCAARGLRHQQHRPRPHPRPGSRRGAWPRRAWSRVALAGDVPGENNYGQRCPRRSDLRRRPGAIRRPAAVRRGRRYLCGRARGPHARARVEYEPLPAILDIRAALAAEQLRAAVRCIVRARPPQEMLAQAPHRCRAR